jgi:hypothetical protein
LESGSLRGLQIGTDARYGRGARVAAVAEVENEAGVAHGVASESGWSRIITAQEFFYFSEQIHLAFL